MRTDFFSLFRKRGSSEGPNLVPRFPVISLRISGSELIATAPGVERSYQVKDSSQLHELSKTAAHELADLLGLSVCRVTGTDREGNEFELVIDRNLDELQDLASYTGEPGTYEIVEHPSPEKRPLLARMGLSKDHPNAKKNRRKVALTAAGAVLVVGLAVPITSALRDDDSSQAKPYQPAEAQLPVAAPPGWGTYAAWHQPVTKDSIPLLFGGRILAANGSQISSLDPETGKPAWKADSGMKVKEMVRLADEKVAVTDGQKVSILDTDSHSVDSTDVPGKGQVSFNYGTPVVTTTSSPLVHVLDEGGDWQKRTMPAGANLAGADGTTITAVSTSENSAKVWAISTDSAKLPEPGSIDGASTGKDKTSKVESCTGVRSTVLCTAKKDNGTEATTSVISANTDGKTTVDRAATAEGSSTGTGTQTEPSRDPSIGGFTAAGMWVTSQNQLVPVGTETELGGNEAFVTDQNGTAALDASGKAVARGEKTKAYPAAVSRKETGIVVASDPSDPAHASVYGLTQTEPEQE